MITIKSSNLCTERETQGSRLVGNVHSLYHDTHGLVRSHGPMSHINNHTCDLSHQILKKKNSGQLAVAKMGRFRDPNIAAIQIYFTVRKGSSGLVNDVYICMLINS